MWPFTKKIKETRSSIVNTIICIPGFWEDTLEVLTKTNGGFMIVGDVLMDIRNKRHYKIDFCDYDSSMVESFKVAGLVTAVSDDFLIGINDHKSVIYIIGETGNFEYARLMTKVAVALLKSSGIGVKVETTGKAFEKEKWMAFADNGNDADLYELFVLDSLMLEDGTTYCCGMKNIGLKDTIISNMEFAEAQRVVRIFNYYQVIDKPEIINNQTFQTEVNSPFYRITEELNQPYKGHELFENPFGMWRLTREL